MRSIGWYSRDGHLDVFPSVSAALRGLGLEFESHYACHNSLEADHLRSAYGVDRPWVLGAYLRERRAGRDISHGRLEELTRRFGSAVPLIRCAWGDLFEKHLREPDLSHNLVRHFEFWEDFLTTNRIDLLVIEVPSILSTCAAWLVCQALGVEFLSFVDIAMLGDRILVTSTWDGSYDEFAAALEKPEAATDEDRARARAYLQRFYTRPIRTIAAARRLALREYERIPYEAFKYVFDIPGVIRRTRARRQYYIHGTGLQWILGWARAAINLRLHPSFSPFDTPAAEDRFVLIPLHQLGEWSDYAWIGFGYADQGLVVSQVSASLPLGWVAYVKEHTAGFGERPLQFYRRLRKLRGVKLISPYVNGFDLIRRARALVTLGSSMGFEALLIGRPVVLLGDAWYRHLPGVYPARTAEDLARLLQAAPDLPVATEDQKVRILEALYSISFDGFKFPHERTLDPDNLKAWARALKRRIESSQRWRETIGVAEATR